MKIKDKTTKNKELNAQERVLSAVERRIQNTTRAKNGKRGARRASPAARTAGAGNLLTFRAQNSRPALSHGIGSLLRTGAVPPVPDAGRIAADADAIVGEMISDLGGQSEMTAQRKAIVESQRMCLLVLGLANSFIRREGLLNRKGKPHPLLGTVVSFANTLRLNAVTLGLERKPRKIGPTSLHEYIEQREKSEPETPAESEAVEVPGSEQ